MSAKISFAFLVSREHAPQRMVDVPTGWVQVLRGARPHSPESCRSLAPGEAVEVQSTQARQCPSSRVQAQPCTRVGFRRRCRNAMERERESSEMPSWWPKSEVLSDKLSGRNRDVPMDGESRSALTPRLIDEQAKRRCLGSGTVRFGHSGLINCRNRLRGVRVGEATNPGPAREGIPLRFGSRFDQVRFFKRGALGETMLGRNAVRRVSVADDTMLPREALVMRFDFRGVWFRSPCQQVPLTPCRIVQLTGSPFWHQIRITSF